MKAFCARGKEVTLHLGDGAEVFEHENVVTAPPPLCPSGQKKCLLPESLRPKAERQQVLAEAELALAE